MTALDDIGTGLTAARLEREDLLNALQDVTAERDALRNLPTPGNTLYGPVVPTTGFATLAGFVLRTGLTPEVVRCYPGGANSLSQVRMAITTYPGTPIVYNLHVASKALSQAQIDTLIKAIEIEAKRVPRFVLCPDAEPDRTDRGYNTPTFLAAFARVAQSVALHGPHIELCLNLTGWDFANRIGAYAPALPYYDTLGLDPYWLPPGTGGVQGSEAGLADAVAWCRANRKKLGLAEWGAKGGDYKLLSDGLTWIRRHEVDFSCYFHETQGSANIGSTALTTPEAFAVYRAGAS